MRARAAKREETARVETAATEPAGVAPAAAAEITRVGFAPIVRIDAERREIELCATSEAVDTYGTVFGYEASRDAFERWAGNVREMHERKAVGRRVAVRCDDAARRVHVRVRISKGAEDTWEKIKDGTLAGASIGASNVEWRRQRVGGQDVPVAQRYDLVELSLVDLPSNPDALGITFVRDGVPLPDLLDELDADSEADPGESTRLLAPTLWGDILDNTDPSGMAAPAAASPAAPDAEPIERRIAWAALAAGRVQLARPGRAGASAHLSASQDVGGEEDHQAAPHDAEGMAQPAAMPARAARLAALGAPSYVERAPGASAPGAPTAPEMDAEQHAADRYTHEPHAHVHTGAPADQADLHQHDGPHLHLDGTSHTHAHGHDHQHADHIGQAQPSGGHSHGHVHAHDHSHVFRMRDGSIGDAALVAAEALRAGAYVGEHAFFAAGGEEGQPLTPEQARVATATDRLAAATNAASVRPRAAASGPWRLDHSPSDERARGPFSDNPDGPPLTGVPARTDERPTADAYGQTPDGNQEAVFHTAARGILQGCGCPACLAALAALDGGDTGNTGNTGAGEAGGRAAAAEVTRILDAHTRRLDGAIRAVHAGVAQVAATLGQIERRVAAIEAQPMPGGPHLRVAEKTHALLPQGGRPDAGEQMRALEALAGRLSDPQAQIAVATEMIRLQQEAAGLPASLQAMPRAGSGAR